MCGIRIHRQSISHDSSASPSTDKTLKHFIPFSVDTWTHVRWQRRRHRPRTLRTNPISAAYRACLHEQFIGPSCLPQIGLSRGHESQCLTRHSVFAAGDGSYALIMTGSRIQLRTGSMAKMAGRLITRSGSQLVKIHS